MDKLTLTRLLSQVASGAVDVASAVDTLSQLPTEEMGYAHIDHHRSLRKGFPEVIFGQGKTAEQIAGIMNRLMAQERVVLATRVSGGKARRVIEKLPEIRYHRQARMLVWAGTPPAVTGKGTILVISAGTSDVPVAREAVVTAEAMGNTVQSLFDVGVAGIHRLLRYHRELTEATVLIVVAGMEGALPSVVGGLVSRPVIAVPTSVGYGTSLGGLTALFGMLNSCSSNVAVVNIDNGFGAAYLASSINHLHLP